MCLRCPVLFGSFDAQRTFIHLVGWILDARMLWRSLSPKTAVKNCSSYSHVHCLPCNLIGSTRQNNNDNIINYNDNDDNNKIWVNRINSWPHIFKPKNVGRLMFEKCLPGCLCTFLFQSKLVLLIIALPLAFFTSRWAKNDNTCHGSINFRP